MAILRVSWALGETQFQDGEVVAFLFEKYQKVWHLNFLSFACVLVVLNVCLFWT